jgi:hypothetical protein
MTFPIEIMLRGNQQVFTETVFHPNDDPSTWTTKDVTSVLRSILLAIDRVQNPGGEQEPTVSLRGISWIASSYHEGVVIALEIHSASAVAGPFKMDQELLTRLVTEAVAQAGEGLGPVVH